MDPYELLGVAPTATLDEAEAAYHRLLRIHHPDLHHAASDEARAAAEARTRAYNAAIGRIREQHATAGATAGTAGAAGGWAWSDTAETHTAGTGEPWQGARSYAWTRTPWEYHDEPHPGSSGWVWDGPVDAAGRFEPCPMCGAAVGDLDDLELHLRRDHGLRLDGRGPRRRRRRRRRSGHAAMSIWLFVPLNGLAAMTVALVVTRLVHDSQLAIWAFAVAMAPTAIRVFSRDPSEL